MEYQFFTPAGTYRKTPPFQMLHEALLAYSHPCEQPS